MAQTPKIAMTTPLVEMDGDEMTRILWQMIKDELICPFVDLKTEYYDLGLENRDATDDAGDRRGGRGHQAPGRGREVRHHHPQRRSVWRSTSLKKMWKSPNGTIRAILDGTVFRAPIVVKGIEPCVRNWTKPITIARHAYGDVYRNAEMRIPRRRHGGARLHCGATAPSTRELVLRHATVPAWSRACTTSTAPSRALPAACFALCARHAARTCGSPPRTPSPRSTTTASRTSFRRSTTLSTRSASRRRASPTSTRSSTTPWPAS